MLKLYFHHKDTEGTKKFDKTFVFFVSLWFNFL